jgi:hypothetical protein
MAGGVNPFGFSGGVIPQAVRLPKRGPQDLPSAPFGFAPPPSKWEQTKDILAPYVTEPWNAMTGLMSADLDTLLYDTGPKGREAVENSFNLAGNLAGASSVVPKPDNAIGIFGGKLAKTADLDALAKAEKMAANDASRDDIWKETGWFQGADGQWRFEIDDSAYRSNPEALAKTGRIAQADQYLETRGVPYKIGDPRLDPRLQKEALQYADRPAGQDATIPLNEYMTHPGFEAAYPNVGLSVGRQSGTDFVGSHQAGTDTIRTGGGTIGRGDPYRDSTALHELQHWIQEKEGFAPGGNPLTLFGHSDPAVARAVAAEHKKLLSPQSWDEWKSNPTWEGVPESEVRAQYDKSLKDLKRILRNLYDPINKSAQETATKNIYKRLSGETEARNVQARMNMTPGERQQKPPWWTEDYDRFDQIVIKGRK